MSHETKGQKTDQSPSQSKQETLEEALSLLEEWSSIARQREIRATRRYNNIRHNLRETAGNKKHRTTTILLQYLQHVTFDSMILLQFTSELLDFAAYSLEADVKLKEHFAEEVAPEIVKNLAKLQKLATETQEEDEGPNGPDHRLFG